MKKFTLITISLILLISGCKENKSTKSQELSQNNNRESIEDVLTKTPILNLGTFHMGFTTDANTTEFDENDKENQRKIHDIVKKLADFKPTVILVETTPEHNNILQAQYKEYLENPDMFFENPSEIQLLAFELGRLANTERIYGIDHHMRYNYMIAKNIKNSIDSVFIDSFYMDPMRFYPEVIVDEDTLNLLDKLKLSNNEKYLDFLMTINADIMTHVGTENGFEGADEASKYYQRNLRM
jgi:uncharacterized protein YfkK (UPF0435 family)